MTALEPFMNVQRKRTLSDTTTVTLIETNNSSTSILLDPLPSALRDRVKEIEVASHNRDLTQLKLLSAEPGGFISSELRKLVWPILLGAQLKGKGKEREADKVDSKTTSGAEEFIGDIEVAAPHQDESQVSLDVNRSFVAFPDVSKIEKEALRVELELVIVTVLRDHPDLRYFQGFHDIVSIFLLTFDDTKLTTNAVEALSLHRIRDSMGQGLTPVLGYLKLLHRIVAKADPALAETIQIAATLPFFSLPWVLTLMSHNLDSLAKISRLFDFLLAHNPAMISYLGAAIVLLKKQELAELDEDDIYDPAILHHTLSKVPNLQDTSLLVPPELQPSTLEDSYVDEDLISKAGAEDDSISSSTSSSSSFVGEQDEDEYDYNASFSSLRSARSDSFRSTGSADALDDSMLYDPDVFGPALLTPHRASRPRHISTSTPSQSPSRFPKAIPISPPPIASAGPVISIDDLISSTLALYNEYPLIGGSHSILADEVMGPKSCIFTWPLSVDSLFSDSDADLVAANGIDIVIEEDVESIKEELNSLEKKKKEIKRKHDDRRRRKANVGITLAVVGVVGVLIAIYGFELKEGGIREWKLKPSFIGTWF